MEQVFLQCRSLTYGQRALRVLERGGLTAALIRTPRALSVSGCGYGLILRKSRLQEALNLLRRKGVPFGPVYAYPVEQTPEEVEP